MAVVGQVSGGAGEGEATGPAEADPAVGLLDEDCLPWSERFRLGARLDLHLAVEARHGQRPYLVDARLVRPKLGDDQFEPSTGGDSTTPSASRSGVPTHLGGGIGVKSATSSSSGCPRACR
jgi:hypothetical protein